MLKKIPENFETFFFGSRGTIKRLQQENVKNTTFFETDKSDKTNLYSLFGVFYHSLTRLIKGISIVRKEKDIIENANYVFSTSDFLPDVIPAIFLKWKQPHTKWIAAFYFFAPKPWQKVNPYATSIARRIMGVGYWLTQLLSYWLIRKWADLVISCNELDRKIFTQEGFPAEKIISIYGGVDLDFINSVPAPQEKSYDAVFMARFHPQKGPLTAVRAWEEVVRSMPHAQLVMIGNGSEEAQVISFIKEKHLEQNITLVGFKDGVEKYTLLKSAKIFLHSAIYETGGMAAAEGMACGLPVVAFDQEGFEYCYPQGLLAVSPIGDYRKMAEAVLQLLYNEEKYSTLKNDALELVSREWDWKKRVSFILDKMRNLGD
ncbi:MAG: glycosyltransferase family 4 protein [Candidatus Moranbacteria bacterium]|nr:glycosyltransferase family 4 protein [Candidatus Moranbacteria bacterium]